MKIAIIGSRNITVSNIGEYVKGCTEIVSGGANCFWDGSSKGTLSVINYAKKVGKDCTVIITQ